MLDTLFWRNYDSRTVNQILDRPSSLHLLRQQYLFPHRVLLQIREIMVRVENLETRVRGQLVRHKSSRTGPKIILNIRRQNIRVARSIHSLRHLSSNPLSPANLNIDFSINSKKLLQPKLLQVIILLFSSRFFLLSSSPFVVLFYYYSRWEKVSRNVRCEHLLINKCDTDPISCPRRVNKDTVPILMVPCNTGYNDSHLYSCKRRILKDRPQT